MGIEFLRKIAKPYDKGLDRRRAGLGERNLYTREPEYAPRAFVAKLRDGHEVAPGEKLGICLDGEHVAALRGLDRVATLTNPPAELKDALSARHGEACGEVREVHDIARMAEITVIW
jgi:hypothetical protein